jgi:hypothetical protein
MFVVYILENPKGRFYIGHTDNLKNRLASHSRTDKMSGKFTRKNGPWSLKRNAARTSNQELEICTPDSRAFAEHRMHVSGRVPTQSGLTDWS